MHAHILETFPDKPLLFYPIHGILQVVQAWYQLSFQTILCFHTNSSSFPTPLAENICWGENMEKLCSVFGPITLRITIENLLRFQWIETWNSCRRCLHVELRNSDLLQTGVCSLKAPYASMPSPLSTPNHTHKCFRKYATFAVSVFYYHNIKNIII